VGYDRSNSKDRMEIIGQTAGDKGKKNDQDLFEGAGIFLKKKLFMGPDEKAALIVKERF
jgi:hypothetical protein